MADQPSLGKALPRTVYCIVPVLIDGSKVEIDLTDDGSPHDGNDCYFYDETMPWGGEWGTADAEDLDKAWGLLASLGVGDDDE